MDDFELNVITKSQYENEHFLCPICLCKNPFDDKETVPLDAKKTFKGSTATCLYCKDAYLVLDEMSIPADNLEELIKKAPIVINSTVGFIKEIKGYY